MKRLIISCVVPVFIASAANAKNDVREQFEVGEGEVYSVSKNPERAFDAASAVYVITQDDIRRSGATSIPEILRLAPGIEVSQIDSNKWAVASRGFNRQFVNKMLVLVDGRSVYTPTFAGVLWDMQDMILEDIDRIEIIRGPGATLWGANAVNGVVNIITRDSRLTNGNVVAAVYGNSDRGNFALRHGGKINSESSYRIYAKYLNDNESKTLSGVGAEDPWRTAKVGYRIDWQGSSDDLITLIGDVSDGIRKEKMYLPSLLPYTDNETMQEANQTVKWQRVISANSKLDFQAYLDYNKRSFDILHQKNFTLDLDLQHTWQFYPLHELTWGLGYRYYQDNLKTPMVSGVEFFDYTPDKSYNNLYSAFAQDKWQLIPDTLALTVGSKFEHNYYTGFEVQPNVRLAWTPDDQNTLWAAVSRAVRIPSRGERTLRLIAAPGPVTQNGQPHYDSEKMTAYEIGYRYQPKPTLSFDLSTFYNDYFDLRTFEVTGPGTLTTNNFATAETYGFELAADWQPFSFWNLQGSASILRMDVHKSPGSSDFLAEKDEGASPQYQYKIQSHFNLPHNVEFDQMLYAIDGLNKIAVPSYERLDMRLAWKPLEELELSLVGQNLLDDRHQEFSADLYSLPSEISRSVYGKVVWQF